MLSRIANSTAVCSPRPVGYSSCIRAVFMTLSLESLLFPRGRLLGQHDERLPLLDDVGGELGCVGGAHVLHRVDRFGRDH